MATYLLIIFAVLAVAVLMARLRIRFEISEDRRLLYFGLGNTGSEIDLAKRTGVFQFFGLRIITYRLSTSKEKAEAKRKLKKPREVGIKAKRKRRRRPVKSWLQVIPQGSLALGKYGFGLLKAVSIEQADATIHAGFDSPDLTGKAFGYYQAALATAPSLVGRVQFQPDWAGPSFAGEARLAANLPAYKLAYQTLLLVFRLPVMKIIKLAIGTKEGVQDD